MYGTGKQILRKGVYNLLLQFQKEKNKIGDISKHSEFDLLGSKL